MEKQEITALTVIDLSAAFDMVDHQVLIEVLRNKFGIDGVALEWYKAYLYPRGCQVKVRDFILKVMDLPLSVPQASCSGANLYSAYASTLQGVIPEGVDLHGFAYDHGYKNSIMAKSRDKEAVRIKELEECARNIKTWMDENRLKMNNGQTKFIMFGSSQHLQKCTTNTININREEIPKSDCIKYLGSWVDALLFFKTHMTKKCQTAMVNLVKICNIRRYLTENATKTLLVGLVLSHLDYTNAILAGLPECDINKMHRRENIAAKLATEARKHDTTTTALKKLHWLPLRGRIEHKLLTLVYKCLQGSALQHLRELIVEEKPRRDDLQSSNEYKHLHVTRSTRKTLAARSFSVKGPELWNKIPASIRKQKTLNTFKSNPKTYLFNKYLKNLTVYSTIKT